MVARRHFAYGLEKVVSEGGFSVTDVLLRFKMNSFRSRAPWLWLSNSTGGCKALLAAGHLTAAFAEEPGCPVGWRWLQCRAALPWKGGKWGWVLSHLCFCRICLACRSSSCSDLSLHYHQVTFMIRMGTAGTRSRIEHWTPDFHILGKVTF